jgi:hypothetical protein
MYWLIIANQTRATLLIDNCPFELHRQLTDVARAANSTISVITVEYDIRDDQPEGTDVFALESSSLALIEKLVQRRYPEISQIDAGTIAKFSGGNARVALALAATIGKDESISGLSDADLFKRLFQQRHEHDPDLLLIAQAYSLVYSFEGVKTKGEGAELPILSGLIGKFAQEVYASVAELKRRDLLQERAEWRAVLPHAIANRLATLALQNIPADTIKEALVTNAPARLRRSFSRRLGYLDKSKEARAIIEGWLAPGGMLADVPNLGEDERAMLANVAPVMPDGTLTAIEHALQGADQAALKKSTDLGHLLRSLAYDPAQFERAVTLLIKFTQWRIKTRRASAKRQASSRRYSTSLFLARMRPVAMRLKVLQGLVQSNDAGLRALGMKALHAMLKSDHFTSFYGFEFGARSRDYGYHPRTDAVMAIASPLALSASPVAPEVRELIADEFRCLWWDRREGLAPTVVWARYKFCRSTRSGNKAAYLTGPDKTEGSPNVASAAAVAVAAISTIAVTATSVAVTATSVAVAATSVAATSVAAVAEAAPATPEAAAAKMTAAATVTAAEGLRRLRYNSRADDQCRR